VHARLRAAHAHGCASAGARPSRYRRESAVRQPRTTSHIVGLKERESQALLDLLFEEVSRPEYAVRFRWTPNAIAMWDNQAHAHAGPID